MSKIVWLDAGHGGTDPGAVGNGLKEKDLTLKIVKYIGDYLNNYDVKVMYTRQYDKSESLIARANSANKAKADLFVSVHINAGGGEGFESFTHPSVGQSTKNAQKTIHNNIINETSWRDRGKKTANYSVLRNTKMSAVLTESGFIDKSADAKKLKSESFLKQIALGHVKGIVDFLNLKQNNSKPKPKAGSHYRVITGSFKNIDNANKRVDELKKKGFESFIEKS